MCLTLSVAPMVMTKAPDGVTERRDQLTLRVDILDLLMREKGFKSVAAQARAAKISRSTLFRLRGSKDEKPANASLPVAMALADAASTTVETLFARRRAD